MEENKSKNLYGNISSKMKIKINDFTYLYCNKENIDKAKKKYSKYFGKKFIKY